MKQGEDGAAVKIARRSKPKKRFWAPQEGRKAVRALLPLPKDIANAVSFSFYKYSRIKNPRHAERVGHRHRSAPCGR